MVSMFEGCVAFNRRLENWDISKVKNMKNIFAGCVSLKYVPENWNFMQNDGWEDDIALNF